MAGKIKPLPVFDYIFSRDDVEKSKASGDWKAVHNFYSTTFDSFLEINAAFKVENNSLYCLVITVLCIFKMFTKISVKDLQPRIQDH